MMVPPDREDTVKVIEKVNSFDAPIEDDEPTSEELVIMLKQAIREANEGKTRPAKEVMRELREMITADDDASKRR